MDTSTGATVTVTMFKSRNRKSSNIRSSSSNSNTNDDDDNDNDGSNSGVLQNAQELKLEQQMRKRKMGVDPVDAIKANRQHEYQRQNELHKQFNSTNNDANISLADGIAHEKLMEQYVEEKLGLKHLKGSNNNSNGTTTTTTTIEDELYRVPELLKSLTSSTSRNDKISDNIGLTSVVEVNLPSTYKLRNIRETEVAIKSSQGNVTVSRIKTMPHSRFQNHYDSTVVDLDLDAIKNEKKGSITNTTNTVSNFAMREEDKISFEVESSEDTVTS